MAEGATEAQVEVVPSVPEIPPLDEVTPYSAEQIKQIGAFLKKRSKLPGQYTFSATGNLESPDMNVALLNYVPLEPAYRDAQEQLRLDAIAQIEAQIIAVQETLRTAWMAGEVAPIIRANQEVADLEVQRAAMRSAVRFTVPIPNPETRTILFDQPYETRKLINPSTEPYQYYDPSREASKVKDPFDKEVTRLVTRDFPSARFYGRYVPDEAVPVKKKEVTEEDEVLKTLKDGRKARIVFDTEDATNGFLSPMWPVEFTFNETRYFTALQAYEAERAKELGNEPLRASLLKTRSARMIRILTQKVTGNPADAKGLWLGIYKAVYQQHPELAQRLLATGGDAIVFADARPGPSGTGVSEKTEAILDAAEWKGENAAGLAQEQVRSQLREATLEEAPAAEAKKAVISEAEQTRARVGAIINSKRGTTR